MSPSRATAPDTEDALLARLQGRPALAGVLIGPLPVDTEPAKLERLYTIGVEDYHRTPLVQQGPREESYVLVFIVEVRVIGPQHRALARSRSWELIDEIELEIAEDNELGDRGGDAELESVPEHNVLPTPDGWIARANVHIRVTGIC